MKSLVFTGVVFSIAGQLQRSNLDISKAIKENGGALSYMITKKSTYLIATEAEVQAKTSKIKTAAQYGVSIVKEAFLWESITAQRILDVSSYLIPVDSAPSVVDHSRYESKKENAPDNVPSVSAHTSSFSVLSKPLHTSSENTSFSSVRPSSSQLDLHPKVQELVEYIYSEATSAFTTNFDAKITNKGIETPLGVSTNQQFKIGVLSSFQIDKGDRVLKEINQILKASTEEVCSNPKLENLSSQFYTTIPHNIGKTKEDAQKHVIRTLAHLQAKQDHLQLMRDILAASSTGALIKSELEVKYKALKCDIQFLNKDSRDFSEIKALVQQNQLDDNIEIDSIYKIKRANEHERFTRSMANSKTLFHGTHITNVVGVLSRGILPPKTVVGTGGTRTDFGWLGSGMYFAPNASSSVKFTTPGSKGTRVMLVATVALGTVKEYTDITPTLERPPMGYHSAHGKPGAGSQFTEDEYAVYKSEQQKLEYLVEFRLRRDVKPNLPVQKSPKKGVAQPSHIVPAASHFASSSYSQSNSTGTSSFTLTSADHDLKSKEDHYRNLFVQNRNHSDLRNLHALLVDISDTSKFNFSTAEPEYPLVLQSHRALDKHTGCAVVSQSQFAQSFDKFTENQFKGLNWDNVFIAGGCVLASMLRPDVQGNGYKSSDVDMFFYGLDEHQANQKLKDIYELVKKNTNSPCEVIRTKHAVTIVNQFPYRHIQIVLRLYKSPAEVLMGFDIDSCAVGYDGKKAYALERACRAITRGYNLVDMSRRSLTYESRLYKYSKRGFAVAIPGFDRSKVNPAIFTKSLKDVKGLAQLLLFEFNAFKNSTTTNPFKSNKVPVSQIRHPDSFTEDRLQEFETLRANKELPDSDYSSVYIPWGPQWFAAQILNLLNYQDKAQFFANKTNIRHKHIFVSGVEGVLEGKSFWCRKCKDQIGSGATDNSGDDYVSGPLKWLQDNPGRQLLTGSFHPVHDDEWETMAYRTHEDGLFNLLSAIFSNDTAQVSRYARSSQSIQTGDPSKRLHPLLYAALLGREEAVGILLREGARQSDVRDSNGLSAMHYAVVGGHSDVVRVLESDSSQMVNDFANTFKVTPLHLACYYGNKEVAEHLIAQVGESGKDALDSNGRSHLHYAALGGSVDCCKLFVHGIQDSHLLNASDHIGLTAITAAITRGNEKCLNYFKTVSSGNFMFGAVPVSGRYSAPEICAPNRELPILSTMASMVIPDGDVNEHDAYGVRPLHVAATYSETYALALNELLARGNGNNNNNGTLNRDCTDVIGQTPIHYVVLYGNLHALSKLESESNLNKPNVLGQTPLHYANLLLGTLSGFQNEDLPGLPVPSYRADLESLRDDLQRRAKAVVLSPYPLPPLLPSEFLSVPSPIERQARKSPQPAVPPPVSFATTAPAPIAGKFKNTDAPSGFTPSFAAPKKAAPKGLGKGGAARRLKSYSDDEDEDSDDDGDGGSNSGSDSGSEEGPYPKQPFKKTPTKTPKRPSGFGAPSVFGSLPTTTAAPSGLFGNAATPTLFATPSTSLFGAAPQSQSSLFGTAPPPQSSLFGAAPQSHSSLFGAAPQPQSPLFGADPQSQSSLFGTAPQSQSSLFGAAPQSQSSLFGTAPQPHSSLFGTSTTSTTHSGLFGQPINSSAPANFAQPSGAEPPSTLARLLVLISLLNKGRNISIDEKGRLKDAALSGHPLLVSALECYEVDGDLEEFADTAFRILALTRR